MTITSAFAIYIMTGVFALWLVSYLQPTNKVSKGDSEEDSFADLLNFLGAPLLFVLMVVGSFFLLIGWPVPVLIEIYELITEKDFLTGEDLYE